jgi:hypothetical protein
MYLSFMRIGRGVDRLLERLRREFGPLSAVDPKDVRKGNHIRVCTLNAAHGSRKPHRVFVLTWPLRARTEYSYVRR